VLFELIDHARYFYHLSGTEDERAAKVIFLHGSGGDSSVWQYQLPWYGCHKLFVPDLPGHGRSEGTAYETPEPYAQWLDRFAVATGCLSFVLVGFSLGGLIAQVYARDFPEKVQGLVLMSTGMQVPIAPAFLQLIREDFQRAAQASCDRAYLLGDAAEPYREGLRMLVHNGPEVYYKDITLCQRFDSTSWVHRITCPVLVMCGSHDTITPPELSQELSKKLPSAKLRVVPQAAHMVMQEQPEQFRSAVTDFVWQLTFRAIRQATTGCVPDDGSITRHRGLS